MRQVLIIVGQGARVESLKLEIRLDRMAGDV